MLRLPDARPRRDRAPAGTVHRAPTCWRACADKHAIVPLVLEHRELSKLQGHLRGRAAGAGQPQDRPACTPTSTRPARSPGRLSSSNPNLQNIPIKTEMGRRVRRGLHRRARAGVLISADYSQVELRILAHLADDPALRRLSSAARTSTPRPPPRSTTCRCSGDARCSAASPSASTSASPTAWARIRWRSNTGMTEADAQKFMAQLLRALPARARMARRHQAQGGRRSATSRRCWAGGAISRNYAAKSAAVDQMKRRAEREAINHPVQGTAADIIKIAMINMHRALQSGRLSRPA